MSRSLRTPVLLSAACALALSGCATAPATPTTAGTAASASPNPAPVVAVATTTQLGSILGDITRCAGTSSVTLMGPGDDPHSFALSSEQVATMVKAKLIVANGLGLEEGMEKALANAKADGAKLYEVAPALEPLSYAQIEAERHAHAGESAEEHAAHADEGHEHGTHDPHVWMDVARMAKAARQIGTELSTATGLTQYTTCGVQVAEKLTATDAAVRATLAKVPADKRIIVTDHESFNYFAAAYGFEVAGVVVPGGSTDAAPSSADLAKLVATIKDEKVPAIFTNTTVNPAMAQAVAREVGSSVKIVGLFEGSVGPAGSGAETYASMMTTNAQRIADALA